MTALPSAPTTRLRFPLLARILVWLGLNLALLAGVLLFVFQAQFQLGLDTLLAGRAGDRIQALSEVITGALKNQPASAWDEIVKNFSAAYKVPLALFSHDGTQLAGPTVSLPPEVLARLAERRGPGEGLGRGPPPGRGPRRGALEADSVRTRFSLHTSNPSRYWVGVRLPLADPDSSRPWPVTLLIVSESLHAGGLFLDLRPWVFVALGALVLTVLFWLPLVRGVTRSLSQLTHATERIADGHFDVRVNSRRGDELGRLAQSVNRMADRLAGYVQGQKRFLGDIAHELCSPLARMQMAAGILEQQADARLKPSVEDLREEIEHMSSLVNELLSFSKAGLTSKPAALEPVPLAAVARRVLERENLSPGQAEIEMDPNLRVLAQPELLTRALANLVRNAVRYAGHAGPVRLQAAASEGEVRVVVSDRGPGVPASDLQKIFDPFYRGEPSRSRETGGIGLGLAIVKTCVEACGGSVSAANAQPTGLEVTLRLKPAPAPPL